MWKGEDIHFSAFLDVNSLFRNTFDLEFEHIFNGLYNLSVL